MICYCLGFAFTPLQEVVLILKNRPAWQAGFLNGVGGKVKDKETSIDAMQREFYEETGVDTGADQWKFFCKMKSTDWEVYCFSARNICKARTITDEQVVAISVDVVVQMKHVLPNLKWLIPMAYQDEIASAEVLYP